MVQPVASDTLPPGHRYRRILFHRGLERRGYRVGQPPKARPGPHDVLLIWNRGAVNDHHARRYEAAGARVIVIENGYIGRDKRGDDLYAMALGHHLGAGTWHSEGGPARWAALNVPLTPWRKEGREVIVLPQRGFGEPGIAMPHGWEIDVVKRLQRATRRPIRVRPHPGKDRPDPDVDLQDAHCAVTWASGAGIKAICLGVPVFYEMPKWIGGAAATFGIGNIEDRFFGDRLPMLERLAWSQWSSDEIETGEPFKWLLQ